MLHVLWAVTLTVSINRRGVAATVSMARQMLTCIPEALVVYKRLLDAESEATLGEALRIERAASIANNTPVPRADIDARLGRLRGRSR